MIEGVELLPPHSHPEDQPAPGPAGRVPANWESLLHQRFSTLPQDGLNMLL